MSYALSVWQSSDVSLGSENNQLSEACMWQQDDKILTNGTRYLKNAQSLNVTYDSYDNKEYAEKIKEFQFYVDKVEEIARPGCSPEMVNVALTSVSSLVSTLRVLSSKQCIHASL